MCVCDSVCVYVRACMLMEELANYARVTYFWQPSWITFDLISHWHPTTHTVHTVDPKQETRTSGSGVGKKEGMSAGRSVGSIDVGPAAVRRRSGAASW